MTIKKPMLAAGIKDEQFDKLRYPLIATPKVDGIRCLKVNSAVVSRSFKPIRNNHIRGMLEAVLPECADGEISSGPNFTVTTGNVMRSGGEPEFQYEWFDWLPTRDPLMPYIDRLRAMEDFCDSAPDELLQIIKMLPYVTVHNLEELQSYEEECLEAGYEGACLRAPNSPYKYGRSTFREHYLLKLKRFTDSEAAILDLEEQMHNNNTATRDAFGRSERSSSKDGKVPADTLGKFVVRDIHSGVEFKIGGGQGLTQALRKHIWDNSASYKGKIVKYRFQAYGVKDRPRIPQFMGFRDLDDMD